MFDARGTLWAMPDGGSSVDVHALDPRTCAVTGTRDDPLDPYDPEDLTLGPDGSLWLADIGDNDRSRTSVAVIDLPAKGAARVHRLTYPDGPHDAEALVLDGQGRPVIVTKEGPLSAVYRTERPLDGPGPTPLVKIAPFALPPPSNTDGPLGDLSGLLVTGAARTADGSVVALRTYTDALLYPVRDGDVAAAFTTPPVQVPLRGEPQGEAIAFDTAGDLYASGEGRGSAKAPLRVVRGAAALVRLPDVPRDAPVARPTTSDSPDWLPAAIGGGAVVAALLLLTALMALRRR